jgi:hypothetical protein
MADISNRKLAGLAAGAAIGSAAVAAAVLFANKRSGASVDGVDAGITRWRLRRQPVGKDKDAPAAFVAPVAEPGAAVSVRDAGPAHIRDGALKDDWSRVDEASDESFPASDPPATY